MNASLIIDLHHQTAEAFCLVFRFLPDRAFLILVTVASFFFFKPSDKPVDVLVLDDDENDRPFSWAFPGRYGILGWACYPGDCSLARHIVDQIMEASLSLNFSYEGWARSKLNQHKLTTSSDISHLKFRQVLVLFENENLRFLIRIIFISTFWIVWRSFGNRDILEWVGAQTQHIRSRELVLLPRNSCNSVL